MKILYFFGFLIIYIISASNNPLGPHGDKEKCLTCHQNKNGRYILVLEDSVKLCSKCHVQRGGNHPVLKKPKRMIKKLPLNKEGRMVCYTCHEPHNRSRYQFMLRMELNSLCINCHDK